MANGTDSEEFVVMSRVRTGLKREFAFALKAQAEISGSLGRTRGSKARNNGGSENDNGKRLKSATKYYGDEKPADGSEKLTSGEVDEGENVKVVEDLGESMSEEDAKSDVVDFMSDDEPKSHVAESVMLTQRVGEDELKNGVVEMEMAIDDEPKVELLKKSEPEKPLVNEEMGVSVKNGDKVEGEVIEKPVRRFTRSALKPKVEKMEYSPVKSEPPEFNSEMQKVEQMKNSLVKSEPQEFNSDMGMDDEPKTSCIGNLVNKDEPKEVQLKNSEPEKPLVEDRMTISVETRDKVEGEVIEKQLRRFTRSALKPKVVQMKISPVKSEPQEFNSVMQKNPLVTPMKHEVKMPNTARKFTKLKELLDTGILEGQPVRYLRGAKVRGAGETGLRGVITGSAITCHCDSCKGTEVVTPTVFELHAGSANKRPPEYIYLENGKTLRDVMNACQNSPVGTLEEEVRLAVGCSSIKKCIICLHCKESIHEDGTRSAMLLCSSCMELKESQARPAIATNSSDESPKPVTVSKCLYSSSKCSDSSSKCPDSSLKCSDSSLKCSDSSSKFSDSLSKCSDTVPKCSSSENRSQGRVTRKDIRLHKLVFKEDVLPDGTEVAYYARGEKLLVGYKKGPGIICSCCNEEVSPSQFEAHAGWASRRKPYLHIYTSNGVSLHELALSLSRNQKSSTKENDDLCTVCLDGGGLMCCDNCPRAFHPECVSLPSVPGGTWYCKLCQNLFDREKYVENNANAVAAGRVAGIDPIEQITNRCIRIVTSFEDKFGGCAICRSHEFNQEGFGPGTVILCDQCESEFHVGCLKDKGIEDLKELPKGKWFCCPDCVKIHSALQKLVVHGEQKLPDSLLNVVRKKQNDKGAESGANLDIKWRVLNGKTSTDDESLELLSKALFIFHDRFAPIIDPASRLDFIKEMLYGGTIGTQEFGGMYCAIITLNQSVISAGMFRIYGSEVAELPLVATSADFQGQGYFQTLFSCMERLLAFLNVRNLVLPAADEAESIWRNKFGFEKLTQNEIFKYRERYQMMIFHGTSMLRKPVPKCRIVG